MAPELKKGQKELKNASDIYSLGLSMLKVIAKFEL